MANLSIVGLDGATIFARASAAAYFDADGVLQSAASGGLRIDHDPGAGNAVLGALLERAATNEWTRSEALDYANDLSTGAALSDVSITADQAAAPDGATTMDEATATGGSAIHTFRSRRGAISSPYDSVTSLFLKAGDTTSKVELRVISDTHNIGYYATIDLSAETITAGSALNSGVLNGLGLQDVGGGIYRAWMSVNHTATSNGVGVTAIVYVLDASGNQTYTPAGTPESVLAWGSQILLNRKAPDSYAAATGGSAVTRAADALTLTSTKFSAALGGSATTVIATFQRRFVAAETFYLMSLHGDSGSERVDIVRDGGAPGTLSLALIKSSGSVAQIDGSYTDGDATSVAAAWAEDDVELAIDGASAGTDTSAGLPAVDSAYLAASNLGTLQLGGHLRRYIALSFRLPSALMEVATA